MVPRKTESARLVKASNTKENKQYSEVLMLKNVMSTRRNWCAQENHSSGKANAWECGRTIVLKEIMHSERLIVFKKIMHS